MQDMHTIISPNRYTTKEAATELGVTDARIRQLCIASHHVGGDPIGSVFAHMWQLDEADLNKIRALRLADGRRSKNHTV